MMSGIGIITFLHNENYGSTLQAWALQQVLLRAGLEARHIDYCPSSKEKIRNLLKSGNSPSLLLDGLRKRSVKSSEADARAKAAAFDTFRKAQLLATAPCHDEAALCQAAKEFDLLLCGSDQIWSPVWFNPAYYLDFGQPGQPRVAYAASLGVSVMPSGRKRDAIRKLLPAFRAISVREEEGAALLRPLTDKPVAVMPDPVCLLSGEEWHKFAELPVQRPGIVCYFIGDRPDYWQQVERLHQETGLPVTVLPVTENAFRQPYTIAGGLSPQAWIGMLASADMIVTDSFHGTAFSLLLERSCTVLRRYRDGDKDSKNSRIDQLFRQLEITDPEQIDYTHTRQRLEKLRRQGTDWLLEAVQ